MEEKKIAVWSYNVGWLSSTLVCISSGQKERWRAPIFLFYFFYFIFYFLQSAQCCGIRWPCPSWQPTSPSFFSSSSCVYINKPSFVYFVHWKGENIFSFYFILWIVATWYPLINERTVVAAMRRRATERANEQRALTERKKNAKFNAPLFFFLNVFRLRAFACKRNRRFMWFHLLLPAALVSHPAL